MTASTLSTIITTMTTTNIAFNLFLLLQHLGQLLQAWTLIAVSDHKEKYELSSFARVSVWCDWSPNDDNDTNNKQSLPQKPHSRKQSSNSSWCLREEKWSLIIFVLVTWYTTFKMIGDIVSTFLALLETTRREGRLIIWPCLALAGEDPQIADSAQTEYCSIFHCPCVRPSQAWHLTFLTYIKA